MIIYSAIAGLVIGFSEPTDQKTLEEMILDKSARDDCYTYVETHGYPKRFANTNIFTCSLREYLKNQQDIIDGLFYLISDLTDKYGEEIIFSEISLDFENSDAIITLTWGI